MSEREKSSFQFPLTDARESLGVFLYRIQYHDKERSEGAQKH